MDKYFNRNMVYSFKVKQWISLPDTSISVKGLKQVNLPVENRSERIASNSSSDSLGEQWKS